MADSIADDQIMDDLREARRQCREAEQLVKLQAAALQKIRAMANDALGVSGGPSDTPTVIKAVNNLDQSHSALCALRNEMEQFVAKVTPLLAAARTRG